MTLFLTLKMTTIILASLIGAAGCNPAPIQTEGERKAEDRFQWAVAVAGALRDSMRNPDKFMIESARLMGGGIVCYQYRAENGFGGMSRSQAVANAKEIITDDDEEFISIWNRECVKSGEEKGRSVQTALRFLK